MSINSGFSFANYWDSKIYLNLNSKILIITNNDIRNKFSIKKTLLKQNLQQTKITNLFLMQIIKMSVFKKFENFITGPIFFLLPKQILVEETLQLKPKNLNLLNTLILKLNDKIYASKKFIFSNFLTYKENTILLLQFNITSVKTIFKN